MAYLLDADWIIHALAGRASARNTIDQLAPEPIAISVVTIGEVYEGAFNSSNPQAHLDSFRQFLRPFVILDLNDPNHGALLGATALHYILTVLTFNVRHLQRIPDLSLYQLR